MSGPLTGVRVLELGGKGPTPFAGMVFADLGADVVVIERAAPVGTPLDSAILSRGKSRLRLDLKSPDATAALSSSLAGFDVVIEGFRPGVAERLGFGPDDVLAVNPAIVYGRMTGYGQGTSYSGVAGHDINFIATSSALAHIGPPDREPVVPLNLVGDFGGGGMLLVAGVLAALVERSVSGRGQVVDAAMTDGSALLMTTVYELHATGHWVSARGSNPSDGGAPFYGVYSTADDRHVSLGALEPTHWRNALGVLGIEPPADPDDRADWPRLRAEVAARFSERDRDSWVAAFEGVDASFAPVLTIDEAPGHPYAVERESFVEVDGVVQPAPAPRFSRTPGRVGGRSLAPQEILSAMGVDAREAEDLIARGVAG